MTITHADLDSKYVWTPNCPILDIVESFRTTMKWREMNEVTQGVEGHSDLFTLVNTMPLGGVIQSFLTEYLSIDWNAYPIDSFLQVYRVGEIASSSRAWTSPSQAPIHHIGSLRETGWDIYGLVEEQGWEIKQTTKEVKGMEKILKKIMSKLNISPTSSEE
ncbi:hypothetical protein KSP40_PGU012969 [Platanthera guangdongensis]|uniref:Uncharacterized protein n=1 Tax=Platanthera guangdongensis TaxID=2320717 RepID=A0ABR2MMK6_9ASPA